MKVIIAGSRTIDSYRVVDDAIKEAAFPIAEVVAGGAPGVDALAERWAVINEIPLKLFPAEWGSWGSAAGFYRNRQMAEYADALIAVWDGKSKGTANMIEQAKMRGLKIFVKIFRDGQKSEVH